MMSLERQPVESHASAFDEHACPIVPRSVRRIAIPTHVARIVTNLFASRLLVAARICLTIEDHQGSYSIASSDGGLASKVSQSSFPVRLVEEVTKYLITDLRTAVALHAGAVGHDTTAVLLPGGTGSGKSSLTASCSS